MPKVRPEKAGVQPTDLGTKSIAEVSAVLDKLHGPACKDGHITPDNFSSLSNEERAKICEEGRVIANDRFVAVRIILKNFVMITTLNRLIRWLAAKIFGESNAKGVSMALILLGLYHRWGPFQRQSKKPHPKGGPNIVPFFGVLPTMSQQRHRMHNFLLEVTHATNYETLELPVPMAMFVTVMDARDREYVLKTNPWNFMKNRKDDPSSFERIFAEILGRGIFGTDGSEWLAARKIASHMFSGTALKAQMEHVFNSHADRVLRLLKETAADTGRVVDIQDVYQSAVFDAFCEIAFGVFPNATDSAIEGTKPQFLISFDQAQQIASDRVMVPPLTWNLQRIVGMLTGLGREGENVYHVKVVNDYIYSIIDQRLKETDEQVNARKDLLSLYIQFSRAQKQPFSREDYRDIIANFMIAGRDTTSCTLTYATKFLGENPAEVKRLREEGFFELGRDTLNAEGNRTISWEESRSNPFADAVVNEVLRLAPPVGNDFRICISDDVLPSGLRVRAGTRVGILNQSIGRDPFLWSEPNKFVPERWMKYDQSGVPQPVKRVDEYVHPIFFAGRRLCLGKDMARFEALVFMSKLMAELDFKPLDSTPDPKTVVGPVIFIDGGLNCTVSTRKW